MAGHSIRENTTKMYYQQTTSPIYVLLIFIIFSILSLISLFIFIKTKIQQRRKINDSTPKNIFNLNNCYNQIREEQIL
uniref:Uncharacterized protein n=1 Tax=Meloidogyne enterolobii TaxID=390850 RepID=A0A6V7W5W2_MELEN|nr:unnamed protein product [Meloidogyne enterolobii]